MGNALNAESRDLLKMLLDGEWHVVDEVRQKLAARVAPGRALRNYEVRQAKRLEKIGNATRTRPEAAQDQRIRSGGLTLAAAALYSMRNYLIYKEEDEVRYVRLRDDIPNPVRPLVENPHGLTEETIRSIVREELLTVAESIDGFEAGLRHYLEASFTELDESLRRRRNQH